MMRRVASLRRDSEGAAVVEFALVAPVFLLMLLGTVNIGQMIYGKAILNGAVERAARSSSLETADTSVADAMVSNAIKPILPGATVAVTRKSYYDFADVARAERFTDTSGNGTCDNGEPYVDENRSGAWEADIGQAGNGSAGDVVLYTVTVTYKPLFSMKFLNNAGATNKLTAVGVRKNQPFANQPGYGSSAGSCS